MLSIRNTWKAARLVKVVLKELADKGSALNNPVFQIISWVHRLNTIIVRRYYQVRNNSLNHNCVKRVNQVLVLTIQF